MKTKHAQTLPHSSISLQQGGERREQHGSPWRLLPLGTWGQNTGCLGYGVPPRVVSPLAQQRSQAVTRLVGLGAQPWALSKGSRRDRPHSRSKFQSIWSLCCRAEGLSLAQDETSGIMQELGRGAFQDFHHLSTPGGAAVPTLELQHTCFGRQRSACAPPSLPRASDAGGSGQGSAWQEGGTPGQGHRCPPPVPTTHATCTRHVPPGPPNLAPQGPKQRALGGKPAQGPVQAGTEAGSVAQGSAASPGLRSQLCKPAARWPWASRSPAARGHGQACREGSWEPRAGHSRAAWEEGAGLTPPPGGPHGTRTVTMAENITTISPSFFVVVVVCFSEAHGAELQ